MFGKILIANRGGIACRVMATARRMGLATVAVYSDADADALHVRLADEAVRIGAPPSTESYLLIDRIVEAAQETGAEAVHPGFGFLSENAALPQALEIAGITFIGPTSQAIAAMGDKIQARRLAIEAGVSTIPGEGEALGDPQEAERVAREVGCPVMLKASAGGGGKGLRVAWTLGEVGEAFASAQSEARSAFGDDRVFVEQYIEEPRHIEVQVLSDRHGTALYLGERECSIQRRHQKVIEEAPSPAIDEETRRAMGEQAVALARAVDYESAGTVEFVVDRDHKPYFLEMNTRLQVEHPVTEMVTGLDIVEQMIRIAAGERLAMGQGDIRRHGWAVEGRIYAEDPDRDFMPSTGRLTRYQPPPESEHVRVDTGVYEGGQISMHYDPMIAQLVTWGETRDEAIQQMSEALDAYVIRGVRHNIPFLSAIVRNRQFAAGELSTAFIEQQFPDGFNSRDAGHKGDELLVAVAASIQHGADLRDAQISGQTGIPGPVSNEYVAVVGQREYPLTVRPSDGGFEVKVANRRYRLQSDWSPGQLLYCGTVDGEPLVLQVDGDGLAWRLTRHGQVCRIAVMRRRAAELFRLMPERKAPDMSRFLLSPMPGLLVSLSVAPDQVVTAGQELAKVEAMKMVNTLFAERDGTIAQLHAAPGDSLAVDEIILEFE